MHEIAAHHDELTLDHSHRTRALQALVCGALTGFSVAILMAPSRGADTRAAPGQSEHGDSGTARRSASRSEIGSR